MRPVPPRPPTRPRQPCARALLPRRPFTSSPLRHPPTPTKPSHPSSASSPATSNPPSRLARLHARLPTRLRPRLAPLLRAPAAHVAAFLLLHELTALVPLLGLAAALHYGGGAARARALAEAWVGEEKVREGLARMERWFRRRGWLAAGDDERGGGAAKGQGGDEAGGGRVGATTGAATGGSAAAVVVELATAYALTKALLPLRLAASVAATPWVARTCVGPCAAAVRRLGAGRGTRHAKGGGTRPRGGPTQRRDAEQ